jgi:hypothetical protein
MNLKTNLKLKLNMTNRTIKTLCALTLTSLQLLMAQEPAKPIQARVESASTIPRNKFNEPVFNLDFPGGSPKDLVKAIEAASKHPVNAVIPDDAADFRIPALKMRDVNLSQLLNAVSMTSQKTVRRVAGFTNSGLRNYATDTSGFNWRSEGNDENRVWYLMATKPLGDLEEPQRPKTCRFYQLAPYLANYKIEDVTTAIKIGWDLLGEKDQPTLKFHTETQLLIAVGYPNNLEIIDSVLRELSSKAKNTSMEAERKAAGTPVAK